jgi:ABC-type cobalamin transport system permease subunit
VCVVVVGTVNAVAGALVCVLTEEDALEPEVLGGRESVAGFLG